MSILLSDIAFALFAKDIAETDWEQDLTELNISHSKVLWESLCEEVEHKGDCNKKNFTCGICVINRYMNQAKLIMKAQCPNLCRFK